VGSACCLLGQLEKASGQAGQREGMGLSARNREEEFFSPYPLFPEFFRMSFQKGFEFLFTCNKKQTIQIKYAPA